jgi:hypothetical protein
MYVRRTESTQNILRACYKFLYQLNVTLIVPSNGEHATAAATRLQSTS